MSWRCHVIVEVLGWHGCWGLWVPIVGVVEWALWTILGPRIHSEKMGEGGSDLAGHKRRCRSSSGCHVAVGDVAPAGRSFIQ